MRADWVAATVRAKAMARRRLGTAAARRLAGLTTLDAALERLADTAYEPTAATMDLSGAERNILESELWTLRVLAGWLPAAGAGLARALAARFEAANIEALLRRLRGLPAGPEFRLGSLAIAWPRLRTARSVGTLREELAASAWGCPAELSPSALHDALEFSRLRMLAGAGTDGPRWAAGAAALVAARRVLVSDEPPDAEVKRLATPLVGDSWTSARGVAELHSALPTRARWSLAALDDPAGLWRAEAAWYGTVEAEAFRLLGQGLPGVDPVVGAVTVLTVDGWRVRAALASAAAGRGPSEVFDVVA